MRSEIKLKIFEPFSKLDLEARDRINLIVGGNGTCKTFRTLDDNGAEREVSSS